MGSIAEREIDVSFELRKEGKSRPTGAVTVPDSDLFLIHASTPFELRYTALVSGSSG